MAFVSPEHRFVFIHITKTGGTSIKAALAAMHNAGLQHPLDHYKRNAIGNGVPAAHRPGGLNVHDPWSEIVRKFPEAVDYRSFAVVRNPWARLYSFYRHKVRRKDLDLPKTRSAKPMPFKDVFRVSNVLLLQPQIWWINQDSTKLLRFEHLEENFQKLIRTWNLPAATLPALNAAPTPLDYRNAYDDYSRDLVGAYYRHEIKTLGYEF